MTRHSKRVNVRDILWQIKQMSGCYSCPESDPICLDFHHRDPKKKKYALDYYSAAKLSDINLLKELLKCDVLCANCHRKHHRT